MRGLGGADAISASIPLQLEILTYHLWAKGLVECTRGTIQVDTVSRR